MNQNQNKNKNNIKKTVEPNRIPEERKSTTTSIYTIHTICLTCRLW